MYIILSTRSAAVCFWTIVFIRTSQVRVPMLSFYVHGSGSLFVYDVAWHSSTTCSTSRSIPPWLLSSWMHHKMISIPLFVSPVTSCKDMYVHLSCVWTLISHEYIPFRTPFFTLFVVPTSSAFLWCRLPKPAPQELLEGRGAQHHRLCGSFESHGQGCEFDLPFYRLVEPMKSANYSTSTYVAVPVLRAARIPVSPLSHIHVRVWVALLPLSRTNEIGKL